MRRMLFIATLGLLAACGNVADAQSLSETKTCSYSSECANDEICLNPGTRKAKCIVLNCPNNAKARHHECICEKGKVLIDNKCMEIKCSADSDCSEIEVCINPGTVKAECAILNCPPYEKAVDHACVKKTCAEIDGRYKTDCEETEEKISVGKVGLDGDCFLCGSNGQCAADGDCPQTEKCVDGKCVPLNCFACQKADEHKCLPVKGCCVTNEDCGKNVKCISGSCYLKTCAEIDPTYATFCSEKEKAIPTEVNGPDGKCVKCVLKTCAELNPQYKTACAAQEIPLPRIPGADGLCFICQAPSCAALVPSFRPCTDVEKQVPTGFQGFDGDCYLCIKKTCEEINSSYTSVCGENTTAIPVDPPITGKDGICYTCKEKKI